MCRGFHQERGTWTHERELPLWLVFGFEEARLAAEAEAAERAARAAAAAQSHGEISRRHCALRCPGSSCLHCAGCSSLERSVDRNFTGYHASPKIPEQCLIFQRVVLRKQTLHMPC